MKKHRKFIRQRVEPPDNLDKSFCAKQVLIDHSSDFYNLHEPWLEDQPLVTK